jgi:amino acid adenylation domain-containing protein
MTRNANLDENINFPGLFDAQVERAPKALALICQKEHVTYEELNRRANQLAHYLQILGVKPESLVGVCLNRSLDMAVGIVGILKAGGAYIPLDPSYPQDRLGYILSDAQAEIVVTQEALIKILPQQAIHAICMDRDWKDIQAQPTNSPEPIVTAENLAYVIYTSGSTGKPKGVMIRHANLCQFSRIACSALDVTANDIYLQCASIAYALSVRQLFIPLLQGATLVIATSEQVRDPIALFELIKQEQVTLMDMVPSFWRTCIHRLLALTPEKRQELLQNNLRRIVSVGEPLLSDIPKEWALTFGHPAKLVNIFGQTETTGVVATYPITSHSEGTIETVPIGSPVLDTELYIGELCVSNPCLARGYLNRPELTAEKFIPNPFHNQRNARLYRTGDMARYRGDGKIEFLGRSDFQVKIRGQRLELGEVEATLSGHTGVQACVAIASGEHPDDKQLIVYIVPASKTLTPDDLRQYMKQLVPDYMVPSAFIFVENLPLTPNGKINRLTLSDAQFLKDKLAKTTLTTKHTLEKSKVVTFTPPQTNTEKALIKIWQELLKFQSIGTRDNFFDLGGHSLMAVRMFARIENDLGLRLPLTTLFHSATIAQLAEVIEQRDQHILSWSPIVPIQTGGNKPPFFGIHGHEGGTLFWRNLVSHLPQDQPFYALQAQGVDGIQPALTNIYQMADLYIREMRKIQPRGPYYIGGYSLGGEIALEIGQQLHQQDERVALLVMFDTRNPQRPIRPVVKEQGGVSNPILEVEPPMVNRGLLLRKISGHWSCISQLSFTEIPGYIFHQVKHRLTALSVFGIARILQSRKKRLPDSILLQYLRMSHSKALREYVPTRYPGEITLFRAQQSLKESPDDSPMGWRPLAGGGLRVYHFDATHEIINEEYAADVAKTLHQCLIESQEIQLSIV